MKKIIFMGLIILSQWAVSKPLSGEIHVNVKGMVCAFCVQSLTKTFKKQSTVENVHVSLEEKSVHLSLKKDQTLDSDLILNLIKDAGYSGTISEK